MAAHTDDFLLPQWIFAEGGKDSCSLLTIPKKMLFETICKASIVTQCRLRQTCSALDNFVKNNEKEFSSHHRYGVYLEVHILQTEIKVFINGHNFELTDDWKAKLSGIPIFKVLLEFRWPSPSICHDLANFIETLNPNCYIAVMNLRGVKAKEEISRILNSIYAKISHVVYDGYFNANPFVTICRASTSHSKIAFVNARPYDRNFDVVKHFKSYILCDPENDADGLVQLLHDISYSVDVGTIQSIEYFAYLHTTEMYCEFPWIDKSQLILKNLSLPALQTLWNSCSVKDEKLPQNIYITKAGGKYLLIIVGEYESSQRVTIHFEIDLSKVLDRVIEKLQLQEFSQTLRKEFMGATTKGQAEILSNAFNLG